jgi:transcriptional antiterminator
MNEQYMDPDDFNPQYSVSLSDGESGKIMLLFGGAENDTHIISATREQLLNLARFIQETLDQSYPWDRPDGEE